MKTKINIVTLGCSKNTVDSEYLIAQLAGSNFEVVHDSNDQSAKIVIVNTCGFIADAREESINTILNFARAKQEGIIDRLFVFGCLSERYKPELIKEIPEVNEFFGVKNLKDIVTAVGGNFRNELAGERSPTTAPHYAWLKISEGCNQTCSYCAIPAIRGKYVSVPVEQLLSQTRKLAAKGVRELLVIAQDTTYYGLDLYGKRTLAHLLAELSKIDGVEWIRLHYAYPSSFPENLVAEIRDNPKICKYLDIPFQHISNRVLNKMRRNITSEETYRLIEHLRKEIPDIALRTTLLVGHPGETDKAFDELKQFVETVRFERLGVFPYSEEEGTWAAINCSDRISKTLKMERADEIMQIQNRISTEINAAKKGSTMKVIIDSIDNEYIIGRTEHDSPEIDQEVLIARDTTTNLRVGNFATVEITDANDYDLFARQIFR
ncbi:MAG: 30S ribosomal protein S12 methylthiotransferase RimO [Prevotellaceae bacterium]|jgi:ribosomal protein S12 methylthiotransferase|nr:30S ribosomal protein S12 methylthiotransferase RimO [Prevotellaceae bacterium]